MGAAKKKQSVVDLVSGRLSPEESLRVLDETEKDPHLSADLDLAAEMLNLVAVHGEEVFADRSLGPVPSTWTVQRILAHAGSMVRPRRFAWGVAAIVLVTALVMIADRQTSSRYHDLARIDTPQMFGSVRGDGEAELLLGQDLLREGRYELSIQRFEWYVRAFPKEEQAHFAHYGAGAAYLLSARSGFLSLFVRFDRDRVEKGLQHLSAVIDHSSNARLVEESRWLRMKGYLMIEDVPSAIRECEAIHSMNGARKDEASVLLTAIQNL